MSLVSVIIPNYNHAQYLDERIQSVLNQTYQNFEIIIIDDCSTDNSKEVIEKYRSDPKITQIIYNTENSGSPFKQWKKGIDLAKGDLVWIAESDDFAENSFLQKNIDKINQYNLVASFTNSHLFTNGKVSGEMFNTDNEGLLVDGNQVMKNWIVYRTGIRIGNTSSAVIKRDVAIKIDSLSNFSNYSFAGDKVFWLYTLLNNRVYVINEKLNYFRSHEKNTSKKALSELKKVRQNITENIKINTLAERLLPLDESEKELLKKEKERRINQVANRTGNLFLRLFWKNFYKIKYL